MKKKKEKKLTIGYRKTEGEEKQKRRTKHRNLHVTANVGWNHGGQMFANYRGVSVTTQLVNVFFNGGVPAVRYTQNQRRIQSTLTLYSRTPRLLNFRVSFRFSVYKVRASSLQFILLASGLLGVLNLPMEIARSCIQRMLKVVNSLVGISGLLVMFYGCWMFAFSQSHVGCSDDALSFWYISAFLISYACVYMCVSCFSGSWGIWGEFQKGEIFSI